MFEMLGGMGGFIQPMIGGIYIEDIDKSTMYGTFYTTISLGEPEPAYERNTSNREVISELWSLKNKESTLYQHMREFSSHETKNDINALTYDSEYTHIFNGYQYKETRTKKEEQEFLSDENEDYEFDYSMEMQLLNQTRAHNMILAFANKKCDQPKLILNRGR